MKTRTKGFIGLFVAIAIMVGVGFFFFSSSAVTEVSTTEFYRDYLYAHKISTKEPIIIALDTWSFKSDKDGKEKNYVVYLYNTNNFDRECLNDYNKAIDFAIELNKNVISASPTLTEAQAKVEWEAYVAALNDRYDITITDSYASWVKAGRLNYKQVNRYTTSMLDYAYPILMIVIMGVYVFMIYRSVKNNGSVANDFGRTKASVQTSLKVRFTDVAGAEEEKEELAEIVEFLKTPQKFTSVGARIPKGVLLVGPPGTGKTLFAKAVAGEANVPFFSISGSDFVEMFVGVGASRVRDLFAQAKKNQPCIIFIDEIDAVGRKRGAGLGGGHDEREQTLNQLLVQMDGFESNESIIIMAATNRADILDPALLRPGRFDRQIFVHRPDVRGREAILKVHSRNKPMHSDVDFKHLARMTSGFTGADIANLLNESAILCARAGRNQIMMEDIFEGINKVILGPQKKSRLVTEVDKRITAYHEGGHAIVGYALAPLCDPVQEISIIPRGSAAGYTLSRPDTDDNHELYKNLCADIAMILGGRAAEELVIQDISTGASGDIKMATQTARRMVTEWGMSEKVGTIYYGGGQEVFLGKDYGSSHEYSDVTGAVIDGEVRAIIEEGHKRARAILEEHRKQLDTLVRVLIERETVYQDEFEKIMKGESAEEVIRFIDSRLKRTTKKTDFH